MQYNKTMFFLRILFIFCLNAAAWCLSVSRFLNGSAINNYTCSASSLLYHETANVRNEIECAQLCQRNTACHGVFYNPGNVRCTGCAAGLRQRDVIPANMTTKFYIKQATKHGQPCDSFSMCGPNLYCSLNGICTCNPGYSYDRTVDSCNTGCLAYGNTFEEHLQRAISGYNVLSFNAVSISACRALSWSYAWCRTFDYIISSSSCNLQSETALTVPSAFVFNSDITSGHRNCA